MRKAKIIINGLRSVLALFAPVTFRRNPEGLDVSLTTYGHRIVVAGISIASFCQSSRAVRDIYLTIDDEEELTIVKQFFLILLKVKGVKIIRGPRRGPHSKYWYYLHTRWDGVRAFFLIDDDVIYERGTADLLHLGAAKAPFNACVRSLCFQVDAKGARPYRTWPLCKVFGTSPSIFATNVGGVIVKAPFAQKLIEHGDQYKEHCQNADDVWFHWVSLRHGMPYTLITPQFRNPTPIPFTQGDALSSTINVTGNDQSVRAIYSPEDIQNISTSIRRFTDFFEQ